MQLTNGYSSPLCSVISFTGNEVMAVSSGYSDGGDGFNISDFVGGDPSSYTDGGTGFTI